MRLRCLVLLVMSVVLSCEGTPEDKDLILGNNVREMMTRGLTDVWTWIRNQGKNENTFVGRCFGAVKRLSALMPLLIFKLGVIVTTLGFLTIFSLKSLGLLILLVILNSSGLVAKLVSFKGDSGHHSQPQNVHLHVHQSKTGHLIADHSPSYGHEYYDRSDPSMDYHNTESFSDRLNNFNVHDPYVL